MQSRTNNTGYFVAVDGPNGSGKTTVINAIAEKLGLMMAGQKTEDWAEVPREGEIM